MAGTPLLRSKASHPRYTGAEDIPFLITKKMQLYPAGDDEDIDFAQTLRKADWKFQTVLNAHMTHIGQTSTTSNFRSMCRIRNEYLYDMKWGLVINVKSDGAPPVSPWIIQSAKNSASQPRDVDLETLRYVTGIAATDLAIWMSRAMSDELSYLSLRQLVVDPKVRRSVTRRTFQAIRRRLNAPSV